MDHIFTENAIIKKQQKLKVNALLWKIFHMFGFFALELILLALIALPVFGVALGLGAYKGILSTAPSIEHINVVPTKYSTFVLDTSGKVTATLVMEDSNRVLVTYDKLPENLKNAFIAIEDERFYSHNGIDYQGILRAGKDVISTKSLSQGASTITQQLLKNNVFSGWMEESSYMDSITRKLQEQYLALKLETNMSKADILLNYLNTINLGQNTLGVEAAAQRYFDKHVQDLALSECAVLAAITQNPSRFNPISNPKENALRRDKVLINMYNQGLITAEEYRKALDDNVYERIQFVEKAKPQNSVNSYFVDSLTNAVLEDLEALGFTPVDAYNLLYSGGLRIYSTQDPKIQGIADEIFSNEENYPSGTQYLLKYQLSTLKNGAVKNYSSEMLKSHLGGKKLLYSSKEDAQEDVDAFREEILGGGEELLSESIDLIPQPQISLSIEDQKTGHVVAMVGGRGEKTASRTLNRATDSYRQPGSTFKVVSTYVPALDAGGFFLESTQVDAPFAYEDGTPVNNWYDSYRGVQTLRAGIKDSLNIVAVKTLTDITPRLGFDYLKKLGFTTLVEDEEIGGKRYTDIQQTLALGGITHGVYNIELNAAYAAIANDGMYIKPKLYTKITDNKGNVILTTDDYREEQVMKRSTAYYLTQAMRDVVTSGTGTACNFDHKMAIAGKTGTTSKYVDQWFSGYTPYYTATVWTGYDDNTVLNTAEKRALAKKLWTMTMKEIHERLELEEIGEFKQPQNLEEVSFCKYSGLLPGSGCPKTTGHLYDAELIPKETCKGGESHSGDYKYRDTGGDYPSDGDILSLIQNGLLDNEALMAILSGQYGNITIPDLNGMGALGGLGGLGGAGVGQVPEGGAVPGVIGGLGGLGAFGNIGGDGTSPAAGIKRLP